MPSDDYEEFDPLEEAERYVDEHYETEFEWERDALIDAYEQAFDDIASTGEMMDVEGFLEAMFELWPDMDHEDIEQLLADLYEGG